MYYRSSYLVSEDDDADDDDDGEDGRSSRAEHLKIFSAADAYAGGASSVTGLSAASEVPQASGRWETSANNGCVGRYG